MPTRRLKLTVQTKRYVSELKLHESDQINFFWQVDILVFANSMIQEYRCLQLGDPLAVGAKVVLSPSCATGPLLSTFFFFASSFSSLNLRKALHCGGHPRPPHQARVGCTEVNGEDHHSPTPRWGGVSSMGLGCIKAYNGGWASRWLLLNCDARAMLWQSEFTADNKPSSFCVK